MRGNVFSVRLFTYVSNEFVCFVVVSICGCVCDVFASVFVVRCSRLCSYGKCAVCCGCGCSVFTCFVILVLRVWKGCVCVGVWDKCAACSCVFCHWCEMGFSCGCVLVYYVHVAIVLCGVVRKRAVV